ncbi:hypothetical protein I7I50_07079 [Histoplasma capsulatum G186AR]|uniref:Uncharacterized protein n=1 Tax=Ajellomyces capsulatus TaxID=5037 RepID=A0A8H7Z1K6_AJECA|nr:hypothetical protein I7I52_09784 [Histoplasma capsulatum]QSS67878.1 hypothetical protein I7I50_07079 [Histoplasma capsulatum G186AR]
MSPQNVVCDEKGYIYIYMYMYIGNHHSGLSSAQHPLARSSPLFICEKEASRKETIASMPSGSLIQCPPFSGPECSTQSTHIPILVQF